MTIDIGNILINQFVTLPWVDKYAGVVKIMSFSDKNKDGKQVIKKFPAVCTLTPQDCSEGRYLDLCPDSKKKSVMFLEDNGLRFVRQEGRHYSFKASFNHVLWLNIPLLKVNECSYSSLATIGMLKKLPVTPFQSSIYQRIKINYTGQVSSSINPFAKYTFDESISQYLIFPYDYVVSTFEVDFMVSKDCIQIPDILSDSCITK